MPDNVWVQICSRKGETQKETVSLYSYIPFHVGDGVCMYVSISLCVCVVWVFLPPETLQTGACLTGSEICLFSSADLCVVLSRRENAICFPYFCINTLPNTVH